MNTVCAKLHALTRKGTLHSFPFDATRLPLNGIYVLFQAGEESHGGSRIVRVGTHRGEGQLRSRLLEHFVNENKDRSIFRKNIGRCLLSKSKDPFLVEWELDRTIRAARIGQGAVIDTVRLKSVEAEVTKHLRDNYSFVVFRVDGKTDRLRLESRIISTVSRCDECKPSESWLGLCSPKQRIRESGLWLVNELYKQPLTPADLENLATHLT
jgi:hypothetical protein